MAIFNGTSFNDMLNGGAGDDAINGADGGDTLNGNEGADVIHGDAGDDYLYGGADDDTIYGDAGRDYIYGEAGNDTIDGGAGNDFISRTAGSDTIHGGDGDDTLWAENSAGSGGTVQLHGDAGSDQIQVTDQFSMVDYRLFGGDGSDQFDVFGGAAVTVSGDAGDDVVRFSQDTSATITLGDGHDYVTSMNGGLGQTQIITDFNVQGASADRLDLYSVVHQAQRGWDPSANPFATGYLRLVQSGADTLVQVDATGSEPWIANDVLHSYTGFQTVVRLVGVQASTLTAESFNGFDPLGGSVRVGQILNGGSGSDRIFDTAGNDLLQGGDGEDYLHGGLGNDELRGGTGNDNLLSEVGGNDQLYGEDGNDLVQVAIDASGQHFVLDGGAGDDSVSVMAYSFGDASSGATVTAVLEGGEGKDSLSLRGNVVGTVRGGGGDDLIFAGEKNDTLDGGTTGESTFSDSSWQGPGDTLSYSMIYNTSGGHSGVTVDLMVTAAQDTGLAGVDTIANFENLYGSNYNDLLFGDDRANYIGGVDGDNVIYGRGGADRITTLGGTDVIDGGTGGDRMDGGAGNDIYFVDNVNDVVIELEGGGIDLVKSSRDFLLSGQLENLTLLDGASSGEGNGLANVITGNAAANTLTGGAGDDVLDGGQGVDRLVGNQGNDTYVVDNAADVVVEAAGEGFDTVVSTLADYTIGAAIEALTLGGQAANGEGNAGDNILTGNRFANVLNGDLGADTMIGGQDSDSYYVDNAGDKVVEQYLEGFDSVLASVNYTLSDYVEQLTLTGSASVAYGNSGQNVLNGNALNNVLDGLGGSDTMIGGQGDDAYWVDNSGDTTVENAGEGFDTVASTISYYISDNIEKLVLVGTAVNASGNSGANILIGDAIGNTLDGRGGADWMEGGLGDDAYWIDNAGDTVVEQAGQGFDTVASFVNFTLSANVEKLILLGQTTYGAGNAGDNTLIGNDLANTLDGGAGADRMEGGLGDDAYWVDNVGDVVVEAAGAGFETIASFVDYTLPANVEQLVLLGTAVRATGNATGNILVGNAVGNILDGAGGGDVLDGGAGADSLTGGTGDDSYWVDNVGDMIFEQAGQGFETVASFVSYTLSANVEKLILLGTATAATGEAGVNILVGNALGNTITGLGGDDWLEGGAGVDHFVVGPGSGHDRIVDFGLGGEHDALDVAAYVAASVTWIVTQQGADTLVAFANGDSVLLADFNSGQLQQSGDYLLA